MLEVEINTNYWNTNLTDKYTLIKNSQLIFLLNIKTLPRNLLISKKSFS